MKTMILYQSKHHGNTKKLVDAICASDPEVQAIDVATVDKDHEEIDLSEYPLIGIASGIYYGKFDQTLLRIMQKSVFDGYMVFGLMTYGGKTNGIRAISRESQELNAQRISEPTVHAAMTHSDPSNSWAAS